jgi:phage antirepressor YoqD-like protein
MKQGADSNHSNNLLSTIEGIETSKSRALRLDLLHRQIEAEMSAETAELRAENAVMKPKAALYDTAMDSQDAIPMRDVAARLNIPNMGRNKLFALLRNKKILDGKNVPYRPYQERGYFRVIEKPWVSGEGFVHIESVTQVYQKGLDYILRVVTGAVVSEI